MRQNQIIQNGNSKISIRRKQRLNRKIFVTTYMKR